MTEAGDIIEQNIVEKHDFFEVIEELVQWGKRPEDASYMLSIRNRRGDYVGESTPQFKKVLLDLGIEPELRDEDCCVCSIGWSEKQQKYYGWSHRAMVGFGVGDKVFEEDFGDDKTAFNDHGRETIQNRSDARRAAAAFAEYVS